MNKKLLALYLPQYHEIKENNIWWGNGYTEWSAVKSAKPLYKGHHQPVIPLNNNYYDLSDENANTWKWQSELAKQFGVYGFCIYHYWFDSKHQILEKPMEILLAHPEIDLNYCICWANETWTKTWYGKESEVLITQRYGDKKEWKLHFDYLLDFFKDDRYIKINNKPMINIYRTYEIKEIKEMIDYWNILAKNEGFDGVYIVAGNTNGKLEKREEVIDAFYNFEPGYTLKHKMNFIDEKKYELGVFLKFTINKIFKLNILERKININVIYKNMLKKIENTKKPVYLGIVPKWDNTPRRSNKGMVYSDSSPKLFKEYLKKTIMNSNSEFIYINAWNEWGEGAFLEPDEVDKYDYLQCIKNTLKEMENK